MRAVLLFLIFGNIAWALPDMDILSQPAMKPYAKDAVVLGWEYFNKRDYATAMSRFQMAIREDDTYAPGWYGIAYIYSVGGNLDQAIKYYRETLKRDQKYPYTYANLGYALLQKGSDQEGLTMLDMALKLDPKCGEAYLSYANYYTKKKDWLKAKQNLDKAEEYGQKIDPAFRKMLSEK